jgi:hypothetical protein
MSMNKAVELGAFVGAQVSALVEAEAEAAARTHEFVEAVGFVRDADDNLALRTISFTMVRRDVDGTERPHVIQIPALTLVPLPLLAIESAQIEFAAHVVDVTSTREDASTTPETGILGKLFGRTRKTVVTRVARTADTQVKADLKVTVKLAQSPFPLGIERLLGAADLSVSDTTPEEQ